VCHWFFGDSGAIICQAAVLQVYIGRGSVGSFSLVADLNYVGDNCPRLARAILEIAVWNKWTETIEKMLMVRRLPLFLV
jgi:hypothetical protein